MQDLPEGVKTWRHIKEDLIVCKSTMFLNGEIESWKYVTSPPK